MNFKTIKKRMSAFGFGICHPIVSIGNAIEEVGDIGIKNVDPDTALAAAGAALVVGAPCALYFSLTRKINSLTRENEVLKIERDTYKNKNIISYNALKAITKDRELSKMEKDVVDVCDAWQAVEQISIF